MINKDDLVAQVIAIGEFIGLLTQNSDGNTLNLNEDWFHDPITEIKTANARLNALVSLLNSSLGPAIDNPPNIFTDTQWFPLPNPAMGNYTPFHFVTSGEANASGQIGLGILDQFTGGNLTVDAFLYVPLFAYSSSGAQFITSDPEHPCQIGLNIATSDPFQIGTVSFTALKISSCIYLSGQAPAINIEFENLQGTLKPGTYHSLKSLLDPEVLSWILEVIVQGSGWLSQYVGNITYTIGDILEAAHYVNRDYLFSENNFRDTLSLVDKLKDPGSDPIAPKVSLFLWNQFSLASQQILNNSQSTLQELQSVLVSELNKVLQGNSIYSEDLFLGIALNPETSNLLKKNQQGNNVRLNRMLLQDAYRLEIKENPYTLNLVNLQGSANDIALNFLFAVLNALSEFKTPLIYLPGGGIFVVQRDNKDYTVDYGINITLAVDLFNSPNSDGQLPPTVTLCLGTWLTGEDDTNNWVVRSQGNSPAQIPEPGLSIFALRRDNTGNLTFAPSFSLVSVGINITGGNNTPLINSNGYTLQGAEVRGNLDSSDWSFGVACRLDNMGIPLGPGFNSAVSGSHTNLVAQNIVESGSGNGAGDQDSVNPSFSLSAAYAHNGKFVVQLYNSDGNPGNTALLPFHRTLGPLQCEKLGVGWMPANNNLSLLFDGSIQLSALNIALDGLAIGIPVKAPTDYSQYDLDLSGMGVTFSESNIELSAALVKLPPDLSATPPRNYIQYDGDALIKGGTFTISALGSYSYLSGSNGYTSLFVFGMYLGDLGGPAFFYVTGLAAGFGYNSIIQLPDTNSVVQFPLVAAIDNPGVIGALQQQDGSWKIPDPGMALSHLGQYVLPQRGEYWLAAGVRFTSFDLIHSSALLVVEFGNALEISLLGLSWMSLPPPAVPGASAPVDKYAYAELGLEVKFLPDEGFLGATAILTPNSFVLDPACHLTGGYAFYVWFGDNPHAGEFVLTLGGYHPDFTPPGHYPIVPRLGFNWVMSGEVTISGDAYFALTPSAMMAGAGLQVLFSSGSLQAWFNAQMDALIIWAPFHYLIDISVCVGASYRVDLLFVTVTLKVELGATLVIWGPKTGGRVDVNWYIISFTITFGADQNDALPPLNWMNADGTGFAQTLLPHKTTTLADSSAASVQSSGIYTIIVNNGLLATINDTAGKAVWIVRPNDFIFSVLTTIPVTEIDITPTKFTAQQISPVGVEYFVCIRPMKATLSSSVITITLSLGGNRYDLVEKFDFNFALSKVPSAKWGKPVPDGQDPEFNMLLDGRLFGLEQIIPKAPVLTPNGDNALNIDITSAYTYDVVDCEAPYNPYHLPLAIGQTPIGPAPQVDNHAIEKIRASLMDPAVVLARNQIFLTLQQLGIDPMTNGSLTVYAQNPDMFLTGNPLISTEPRHARKSFTPQQILEESILS